MATVLVDPKLESVEARCADATCSTQELVTTWSWMNNLTHVRHTLSHVFLLSAPGVQLDQDSWDGIYDEASLAAVAAFAPAGSATEPNPVTI